MRKLKYMIVVFFGSISLLSVGCHCKTNYDRERKCLSFHAELSWPQSRHKELSNAPE